MSSNHNHNHTDHHDTSQNIAVAFALNLGFAIVELFGGLWTNSTAILSDALHDLGDSISLGASWYFERISKKGASHRFSYGLKRFSVIGAIINSLVLLGGSVAILFEVIPRLIDPQPTNATGMLLFAIGGVVVNGLAMLKLRGGHSLNQRVVALHLMEDVLGWVAVLIGSLVMMWWDVPILDPILSLAITAYILFNVVRNIRSVIVVILQGIPDNVDPQEIAASLLKIRGVEDVHDLHLWSMDADYNVLSTHVVTSINADNARIKKETRELLSRNFSIWHSTIEIEEHAEECQSICCNTFSDGKMQFNHSSP